MLLGDLCKSEAKVPKNWGCLVRVIGSVRCYLPVQPGIPIVTYDYTDIVRNALDFCPNHL